VTLPVLALRAYHLAGDPPIGVSYDVTDRLGRLTVTGQAQAQIDASGQIRFPLLFTPDKGARYTALIHLNDIHGNTASRRVQLLAS
jgi:hypothetical protein